MSLMDYEAEVVPGLDDLARTEMLENFGSRLEWLPGATAHALRFRYRSDPSELERLRTVSSLYTVQHFAIPRPKALLGHQNFQRLLAQIRAILDRHPPGSFDTLHLSAAGPDSSVMQRIKDDLAQQTGLRVDDEAGDLLLRLVRARERQGWDALVRLTPRPLTARPWRVVDWRGALNASVAAAMNRLLGPAQRVLNLTCGTGSLLIERHHLPEQGLLLGVDVDPTVLDAARQNAQAAQRAQALIFVRGDGRALPLAPQSVDGLLADWPFGQAVGSHQANQALYPALLMEAARVAQPGARFVLITHEIKLMAQVLDDQNHWRMEDDRRITLRGLHPHIYVLQRRATSLT